MNEKIQGQHHVIYDFINNRDSIWDYIIILDAFFLNFVKTDEFASFETEERENIVNVFSELRTLLIQLVAVKRSEKEKNSTCDAFLASWCKNRSA